MFWLLLVMVALVRVVFSFGALPPDIGQCLKQKIIGEGVVVDEPERKETGQVLVVSAIQVSLAETKSSCAENISIRIKTDLYPRFYFGDYVTFSGKLAYPFNFRSDNGRTFDYRGFLAKDDIFHEIKSGEVFLEKDDITKNNLSDHLYSILFSLKRTFVSNIQRVLGEPHSALASGLVVGEKGALGKDLLNNLRIVGLIHIVVLSGFNITIVADALRRLLIFLPRVWGIAVGGIGIVLFGLLVGGGATVVRSCLMASIALLADLSRRDYDAWRALVLAGLVMVIESPMILFHDPSFQLSFLATFGLVTLARPIEKYLSFLPERFGLRGIVATTLSAQIFVSPYIIYAMGQLSVIGVIANILILPFVPVTMLAVFVTGISGFVFGPLSQVFALFTHILLSYQLTIIDWFAHLPFASVSVSAFPVWFVYLFYALVILALTVSQLRLAKKSST